MTTLSRWILTLLRILFLPGSHSRWSRTQSKKNFLRFNHFQISTTGSLAPAVNDVTALDWDPPKTKKNLSIYTPLSYDKTNHPKSNGTSGDTFSIWSWAGRFTLFLHFSPCCTEPKTRSRRNTHTQPLPNSFFFALHNTASWLAGFHFFTLEGGEIFFHPNFFGCQSPLEKCTLFPRLTEPIDRTENGIRDRWKTFQR